MIRAARLRVLKNRARHSQTSARQVSTAFVQADVPVAGEVRRAGTPAAALARRSRRRRRSARVSADAGGDRRTARSAAGGAGRERPAAPEARLGRIGLLDPHEAQRPQDRLGLPRRPADRGEQSGGQFDEIRAARTALPGRARRIFPASGPGSPGPRPRRGRAGSSASGGGAGWGRTLKASPLGRQRGFGEFGEHRADRQRLARSGAPADKARTRRTGRRSSSAPAARCGSAPGYARRRLCRSSTPNRSTS